MRRRRQLIALLGALALLGLPACTADTFGGGDAAAADAGGDGAATGCACSSPQTCCVYTTTQTATYTCAQTCAQPSQGQQLSQLACTSSADCVGSGGVCCIWRANGVNQSVCASQCDSASNQVQLCDPSTPDTGCPSSQPCSTNNIADWNLPQSFATCGGQGVP